MAHVKVLGALLLLLVLSDVTSSQLIYRKYEKKHPKKNYVQVVEIFKTRQAPPHYTQNEKELNDFLARDSYKTDMNCTKHNDTDSAEIFTRPTTVATTYPTIPTTAYRRATTPSPPRTKFPTTTPNLNELFTIRTRKPTIKPNPRENNNPDYTNLNSPKPNVQVTKHPPSPIPPTIVIQETDDHPTANRTTLVDVEGDQRSNERPETEATENEIFYLDSNEEENGNDDDYREEDYDSDVIPKEQFEPKENHEDDLSEEEEGDYDDEGDDDQMKRRRKRHRARRVKPLRTNTQASS